MPFPDELVDPEVRERIRSQALARGTRIRRRRTVVRRSAGVAVLVAAVSGGIALTHLATQPATKTAGHPTTTSAPLPTTSSTVAHTSTTKPSTPTSPSTVPSGSGTTPTTLPKPVTATTSPPPPSTVVPLKTGPTVAEDWVITSSPSGVSFTLVSCGSSSFCVAADGQEQALVTTDLGQSWTTVALPAVPEALSCGSATDCLIAASTPQGAEFVATTDAGHTWSVESAPASTDRITSVSCWDGSDCLAAGLPSGTSPGQPVVYSTSNGGSSWTEVSTLTAGDVVLDCQSASSCWVADGGPEPGSSGQDLPVTLEYSADGGTTWTTSESGFGGMQSDPALACSPDGSFCLVAGSETNSPSAAAGSGLAWVTTDGGSTWQATQLPAGVSDVSAVDCLAPDYCWAAGTAVTSSGPTGALLLTTNGQSWQQVRTLAAPGFSSLACPFGCVGVGAAESGYLLNG